MKIEVKHTKAQEAFKEGDIVRHKNTGNLFILDKQVAGHCVWKYFYFDITSKRLSYSATTNGQFMRNDYELFEGTITLSNEA